MKPIEDLTDDTLATENTDEDDEEDNDDDNDGSYQLMDVIN